MGRPIARVDEAHQIVAHVVERVAAGRARGAALAAQVDGEGLEVLGEERQRRLVAPPRLGLAGDQQQRRLVGVAGDGVVERDLAGVEEPLGEGVRERRSPRDARGRRRSRSDPSLRSPAAAERAARRRRGRSSGAARRSCAKRFVHPGERADDGRRRVRESRCRRSRDRAPRRRAGSAARSGCRRAPCRSRSASAARCRRTGSRSARRRRSADTPRRERCRPRGRG